MKIYLKITLNVLILDSKITCFLEICDKYFIIIYEL